jgi:glycerol-3-phosphate dehydrogenase (NAD(P)+)
MTATTTAPPRVRRAAVVGSTGWGTTLALLLARNKVPTTLLARDAVEQARLRAAGEHERRLPGARFPEDLAVEAAPAVIAEADLLCFAVPSRTMAENLERIAPHVAPGTVLLSATKGIERESGRRMSEIITEALPGHPIAVLSGPNLSREVAASLPSTTVIACASGDLAGALRIAFHSNSFRVYSSTDLVGVELGGALKNVIAIAGGIVDALGYGDNAKAAILTRGLAEMTRLGVAAGAEALTFQGLAGVGDLIASAYSPLARNRRLGELLGRGVALEAALAELDGTAEGAVTTPAALALAGRLGVEMPIAEGLAAILAGRLSPEEAVRALMERLPKPELAVAPGAAL